MGLYEIYVVEKKASKYTNTACIVEILIFIRFVPLRN